MNGQMKKYKESLGRTPEPKMPSQIPKVKLDMRGLVQYAKERGVAPIDLTQEEKECFMQPNSVESKKVDSKRIGIAKGQRLYDDEYDFDEMNPKIEKMFGGLR